MAGKSRFTMSGPVGRERQPVPIGEDARHCRGRPLCRPRRRHFARRRADETQSPAFADRRRRRAANDDELRLHHCLHRRDHRRRPGHRRVPGGGHEVDRQGVYRNARGGAPTAAAARKVLGKDSWVNTRVTSGLPRKLKSPAGSGRLRTALKLECDYASYFFRHGNAQQSFADDCAKC